MTPDAVGSVRVALDHAVGIVPGRYGPREADGHSSLVLKRLGGLLGELVDELVEAEPFPAPSRAAAMSEPAAMTYALVEAVPNAGSTPRAFLHAGVPRPVNALSGLGAGVRRVIPLGPAGQARMPASAAASMPTASPTGP